MQSCQCFQLPFPAIYEYSYAVSVWEPCTVDVLINLNFIHVHTQHTSDKNWLVKRELHWMFQVPHPQNMIGVHVVVCAVLLAALVSPSQEHAIGNATCGLKFQEHIKAAIAIKKECASAVFDDCCQVNISEWTFPSVLYRIIYADSRNFLSYSVKSVPGIKFISVGCIHMLVNGQWLGAAWIKYKWLKFIDCLKPFYHVNSDHYKNSFPDITVPSSISSTDLSQLRIA